MPYNLVFSRTISSDAVMRIVDVPILERSVMIEVLSLISPFRRLAGYAYALRSDGITDYERSAGVTLPFGKTRVNFGSGVEPYGLEFFPRLGVKSGIISVYTGEPESAPPSSGPWRAVPSYDTEFRLSQNPNRIEYRQPIGSSVIRSMAAGAVAGAECFRYVTWEKSDGTYWYTNPDNLVQEFPTTKADYDVLVAKPEATIF